MPPRDATADFLARLRPASRLTAALQHASVEDLEGHNQRLAQIAAALPLSTLTPEQRQLAAGPGPAEAGELLHCAAEAIAKYGDAQAAVGAAPDLFAAVAEQGIALDGLCVRAEQVERAAIHGALLLSEQLAGDCDRLRRFATTAPADPARPAAERAQIESGFAAALHQESAAAAQKKRAQQRTDRRLQPFRDQIARSAESAEALDTINRFLGRARDAK